MNKTPFNINGVEFTIYSNDTVFGDGSHESTATMLDLMAQCDFKGKKVLDIGTGTGILSVFAALSGAEVTAVDLNPAALEFARKNFKHNGVDVNLELNDLTQDIEGKYDFILANLPPAEQVENLKTVEQYLADGGTLIISWLNYLDLNRHAPQFTVVQHIENREYDGYVLRLEAHREK